MKKNDFSPNLELAAVTTRSSRVDDLNMKSYKSADKKVGKNNY